MISEARKKEWNEEIKFLLDFGEGHLSEWEESFVDSISKQLAQDKELSFKQSSVLRKISIALSEKL